MNPAYAFVNLFDLHWKIITGLILFTANMIWFWTLSCAVVFYFKGQGGKNCESKNVRMIE